MEKFPNYQLTILDDATVDVESLVKNKKLLILVFYRGFHCSVCYRYVHRWGTYYPEYANLGIEVVAVSTDTPLRAQQAKEEWFTGKLPMAHSFSLKDGKDLGMHISHGFGSQQPEEFLEPALFVLKPNLEILASSVQSTPYARPDIKVLLHDLEQILAH
ncbi:redoxin domain-containing protein [Pontibacter harenae]|uniref:redoxin domain-containing protein n=1 Tax=Pontibacter harenae TaxID=2894083 RepID=UPI001E5545F1|nr:redoxin domain-containing protein [Pontibacter harenae]MCC9167306.1 redoxin domain-containing protein [Pontibacter harenae]